MSRFSLSLSQKKRDTEQEQELHFIAKETSISEKEMVIVHHHIFFKKGIRTEINAVLLFSETKVGVVVSRERITRNESPLASFYGQGNRGTERLHDFDGYGRIEPKLSSRPPEILCPLLFLLHIFLLTYMYFSPQ